MDYTITSHDDNQRTITITCKGYTISILYPEDAQTFVDIDEESLRLLIGGVVAPYANMPDYTDPNVVVDHNRLEWF